MCCARPTLCGSGLTCRANRRAPAGASGARARGAREGGRLVHVEDVGGQRSGAVTHRDQVPGCRRPSSARGPPQNGKHTLTETRILAPKRGKKGSGPGADSAAATRGRGRRCDYSQFSRRRRSRRSRRRRRRSISRWARRRCRRPRRSHSRRTAGVGLAVAHPVAAPAAAAAALLDALAPMSRQPIAIVFIFLRWPAVNCLGARVVRVSM